jgi:hypothetical protein
MSSFIVSPSASRHGEFVIAFWEKNRLCASFAVVLRKEGSEKKSYHSSSLGFEKKHTTHKQSTPEFLV